MVRIYVRIKFGKWLTRTYVCFIIELIQERNINEYKNCSLSSIIGVGAPPLNKLQFT